MAEGWTPPLRLEEIEGACRLSLGDWSYGQGSTIQEAADDLVDRLLRLALGFRSSGFHVSSECPAPDGRWLEFVWELGERAARGEDIRPRVLGPIDGSA